MMNDERYVRKGYKIWDTYLDREVQELNYRYQSDDICELLNEKDRKIRQLERSIERREEQISIIKKHCLKFLTDEQFETIRKALEDE